MNSLVILASIQDPSLYWMLGAVGALLLICIIVVASSISTLTEARAHWKKVFEFEKSKTLLILLLFGSAINLSAQETTEPVQTVTEAAPLLDSLAWWMIAADLFLLVILLSLVRVLKGMIRQMKMSDPQAALEPQPSFLKRFMVKLTAAVPMEEEEAVLSHHEYDGIRELDNKLPPWWVYMFYASIVFAFAYVIYYHMGPGKLQEEEYHAEILAAEELKKVVLKETGNEVDENTVQFLSDAGDLDIGKSIYSANCAACHGQLGEGGVGPNLTDVYWLHGGSINDVFKSVKYGIPQKGMIPWQNTLTPVQIQKVSSYILSLKGSNPPNAKEPQGDPVSEDLVQVNPADSTHVK